MTDPTPADGRDSLPNEAARTFDSLARALGFTRADAPDQTNPADVRDETPSAGRIKLTPEEVADGYYLDSRGFLVNRNDSTDPDLAAALATADELDRLAERATPGPWVIGGPYPGTSVIVCVDGGCGWPNPEPPVYEPIAILDSRIDGEPSPVAQANAALIAACDPDTVRRQNAALRSLAARSVELRLKVDDLTAALAAAQASLDGLYGEKFSDRCYHALKSRAETAETQRDAAVAAAGEAETAYHNSRRDWLNWAALQLRVIADMADDKVEKARYNRIADRIAAGPPADATGGG